MIENTLERIAVALETIAQQGGLPSAVSTPAPAVETPAPAPAAPAAAPPAPPAPTPGLPPNVTQMPPQAPAAPAAPGASLDDIRAKANDFHRAHPDRAAEVVAILASVGAQKMTEIPQAQYANVLAQLNALGA